jgi:hypothetical protein
MKRIKLIGPTVYIVRKDGKETARHRFEAGRVYEVDDAIADSAFISSRAAVIESVATAKAKAGRTKKGTGNDGTQAADG